MAALLTKPVPALRDSDRERFWSKVTVRPDGCWAWTGGLNASGYGYFYLAGRMIRAHRIAYVLAAGEPPPDRPELDHVCGYRACVRPSHLEPVSRDVNVLRTYREGGRCEYLRPDERAHFDALTDQELADELARLEASW